MILYISLSSLKVLLGPDLPLREFEYSLIRIELCESLAVM